MAEGEEVKEPAFANMEGGARAYGFLRTYSDVVNKLLNGDVATREKLRGVAPKLFEGSTLNFKRGKTPKDLVDAIYKNRAVFGLGAIESKSEYKRITNYASEVAGGGVAPTVEKVDELRSSYLEGNKRQYNEAKANYDSIQKKLKDAKKNNRKAGRKVAGAVTLGVLASLLTVSLVGAVGASIWASVSSALSTTFGIAFGFGIGGIALGLIFGRLAFKGIVKMFSKIIQRYKKASAEREATQKACQDLKREMKNYKTSMRSMELINSADKSYEKSHPYPTTEAAAESSIEETKAKEKPLTLEDMAVKLGAEGERVASEPVPGRVAAESAAPEPTPGPAPESVAGSGAPRPAAAGSVPRPAPEPTPMSSAPVYGPYPMPEAPVYGPYPMPGTPVYGSSPAPVTPVSEPGFRDQKSLEDYANVYYSRILDADARENVKDMAGGKSQTLKYIVENYGVKKGDHYELDRAKLNEDIEVFKERQEEAAKVVTGLNLQQKNVIRKLAAPEEMSATGYIMHECGSGEDDNWTIDTEKLEEIIKANSVEAESSSKVPDAKTSSKVPENEGGDRGKKKVRIGKKNKALIEETIKGLTPDSQEVLNYLAENQDYNSPVDFVYAEYFENSGLGARVKIGDLTKAISEYGEKNNYVTGERTGSADYDYNTGAVESGEETNGGETVNSDYANPSVMSDPYWRRRYLFVATMRALEDKDDATEKELEEKYKEFVAEMYGNEEKAVSPTKDEIETCLSKAKVAKEFLTKFKEEVKEEDLIEAVSQSYFLRAGELEDEKGKRTLLYDYIYRFIEDDYKGDDPKPVGFHLDEENLRDALKGELQELQAKRETSAGNEVVEEAPAEAPAEGNKGGKSAPKGQPASKGQPAPAEENKGKEPAKNPAPKRQPASAKGNEDGKPASSKGRQPAPAEGNKDGQPASKGQPTSAKRGRPANQTYTVQHARGVWDNIVKEHGGKLTLENFAAVKKEFRAAREEYYKEVEKYNPTSVAVIRSNDDGLVETEHFKLTQPETNKVVKLTNKQKNGSRVSKESNNETNEPEKE